MQQQGAQDLLKLEVTDFSGGMTDNYLLGNPKRYKRADNFLLNSDKKMELRPGSWLFDEDGNHLLQKNIPIGGFFRSKDKTELFVHQGRQIHYLNPNWTELTGPEGGKAISGGDTEEALSTAYWKQHIYFTSAGGGQPGYLYKDQDGVYQVRTAGLPFPRSNPRYDDTTLLVACINLANELRSAMIAHMSDASTLHDAADKYSLAYFSTQSWSPSDDEYPGPGVTAAPAADDEDSLFVLTQALCLAYKHHGRDSDTENLFYHKEIQVTTNNNLTNPPKGPFKIPSDMTLPTSLDQVAATLDELHTRWNWHRLALFTHIATNDYTSMNLYPISVAKIGDTDRLGAPRFVSNFDDLIRYVNYLKSVYNIHVSNGSTGADWTSVNSNDNWHTQKLISDLPLLCRIPDALTVDDAYLITYWIWALYGMLHVVDANIGAHTNFTMDTSAGSADVTDVKTVGALTLPVGATVTATTAIFESSNDEDEKSAEVTVSASGTATFSKPLKGTQNDQAVQYSLSFYHGSYVAGALTTITATALTNDERLDPQPTSGLSDINEDLPTSAAEWVSRAQAVFQALSAHMANAVVHQADESISNWLTGNGDFFIPEIVSYGYAFVNKYTYETEEGLEFEIRSEPIFLGPVITGKQYPPEQVLESGFSENDTNDDNVSTKITSTPGTRIRNLPVLENTADTNYDVAEVKVEIYRTKDVGNTYYLLDEVDNGTAEFVDYAADDFSSPTIDALDDRETLYTTGGVVANILPPVARFVHILQNTAYYGYVTDTGETFKNRIVQSIPGSPYAVPGDFFDDLDDELVGITSARNNVLALCLTSLYRMNGAFDNTGKGFLTHESISEEIGCISTKSIVETEIGVFFAGTDGFYYTDGFQLIKISLDIDFTYAERVFSAEQRNRLQGVYDEKKRRIWWTMQSNPYLSACDEIFVYNLNYGVKPSGAFTTATGLTSWQPSAVTFWQGDMIRGDARGFIFRHRKEYRSDPAIPASASDWGTVSAFQREHIPFKYTSCALDFGTIAKGNFATKFHLLGDNAGNVNVQLNVIRDNNNLSPAKKSMAPIVHRKNPMWGDARIIWGDPDFHWQFEGKLDHKRRFPNQNLRSQIKQVEMVPARVGVYSYDEYPEFSFAAVNATTNVVTISTPTGYDSIIWPLDVVGMYIAFETDDYEAEYEITAVSTTTITIADPDNDFTANLTGLKWVIRGYQKEVNFKPLGYVIFFDYLGERGNRYNPGAGAGENSG